MNVAINGFGRIGRMVLHTLLKKQNITVVAINDVCDTATLSHLFKYDSIHGNFKGNIHCDEFSITINKNKIKAYSEKNPENLPWNVLNIDLVIEATGKFLNTIDTQKHINAGAKQVLLTAPSPNKNVPTIVLGINNQHFNWQSQIISNASCTTNNVAPMIKILDDNWGIKSGYITTVHSMTGDQNLHDAPHRDLRRARAASASIIPTSTGAAKAITNIFKHLENRLGGAGIRVPVLNGSLTDFTCILETQPKSVAEINLAFKTAAETNLKHILEYTDDPIVSVDVIDNPHSCIFDAQLTSIVGNLVKVVGWYDNEIGFANRLADVAEILAQKQLGFNK